MQKGKLRVEMPVRVKDAIVKSFARGVGIPLFGRVVSVSGRGV
jgi:hypothetical protein